MHQQPRVVVHLIHVRRQRGFRVEAQKLLPQRDAPIYSSSEHHRGMLGEVQRAMGRKQQSQKVQK